MRFLLSLVLVALAIATALGAAVGAMVARNVLDTPAFTRAVVATVQSPEGAALVRTAVAYEIANRSAAQPDLIAAGAATIAGRWAVRALHSDAATQFLAPAAVGLQQGVLTGTQKGTVQIDVRAMAAASSTPAVVRGVLDVVGGPLLITVPWVTISPEAQMALQELDRHRWLPPALGVAAMALGLAALLVSRRRGLTLIVLGIGLAVSAYWLRPLAGDASTVVVSRQSQSAGTAPLARVFILELFNGWSAVSGALIAIGLALALVGAVFGLRRVRS